MLTKISHLFYDGLRRARQFCWLEQSRFECCTNIAYNSRGYTLRTIYILLLILKWLQYMGWYKMSDLSETNTMMFDSVVSNYQAFSWLAWDLPKELDEAIKTYKRGDAESAFCIFDAYFKHMSIFHGLFSSAIWELSNSLLMTGLKQLLVHNVMTIHLMRDYFMVLARDSKPNELAEAMIDIHRRSAVLPDPMSAGGLTKVSSRVDDSYQEQSSKCQYASSRLFKRSQSEEELHNIWASRSWVRCA